VCSFYSSAFSSFYACAAFAFFLSFFFLFLELPSPSFGASAL
jgi:hypothetical protein